MNQIPPCFDCDYLRAVPHFGTKCSNELGKELFNKSDDFPRICPFFKMRQVNYPDTINHNYTLGK